MVDDYLVASMRHVSRRLHSPQSAGVALPLDRPWEWRYSAYLTVITDHGAHHLYYRGRPALPQNTDPVAVDLDTKNQVTCYARSEDGRTWTKPELALFEVQDTRANNVILARDPACTNFTPFLNKRPGVSDAERWKAVGGVHSSGLRLFASADGVHWRFLHTLELPQGAFNSQNIIF
jgi:sucrose-6-phosphate hydrolase SacC (GH32 family)